MAGPLKRRGDGRARHSARNRVVAGIGDDCAVLRVRPGHELLVTTDFTIEGIHFRREWHPPESIGHRSLARGLSDIAAMGGEPLAAFLSLALPRELPQRWVDRFLRALLRLARRFNIQLAGGDTSESPSGVVIDVAVVGSVVKGEAILRSGARPGDRIYVTGELGAAAATLDLLASTPAKKLKPELFSKHFFPMPRIQIGRILGEKRIPTAMIDTSDGLSTDLSQLCAASRAGAEIWSDRVPRATIGQGAHEVNLEFALHGGEDYELLFTAPRRRRVPAKLAGVAINEIGFITARRGIFLRAGGSLSWFQARGWEHFRRSSSHK